MKIVHPRDLLAADLPGLESPFFAVEKARNLIQRGSLQSLARLLGRPVSHGLGARAFRDQRNTLIETILREIQNGQLFLVHESIDGEPSSPVVQWQGDSGHKGRWQMTEAGGSPEVIASVEALNQHGITLQKLRAQSSTGIGNLPAGDFAMEYRLKQREEALQREPLASSSASSPAPKMAPVLEMPETSESPSRKPAPEIHLEIGIFTDGTLNNAENSREMTERIATECVEAFDRGEMSREECEYRLSMTIGGSYGNAPSNVAKLATYYDESKSKSGNRITHRLWVYAPGIGTKTGKADSLVGSISGMGETGIVSQVREAFADAANRISGLGLTGRIRVLKIDLFGFSRGAASARHAVYEINQGQGGALGEAFRKEGLDWPQDTKVRFVGLFDTVAAIVNPLLLDLAPGNNRNEPVKVALDPAHIDRAVHIVAADEIRKNFALNSLRNGDGSLAESFREIVLPGVHSDIGGGYPDVQREDVLLTPYHLVPVNRHRWPERTIQWDNLEEIKSKVASEGWVSERGLSGQSFQRYDTASTGFRSEAEPYLGIYKKVSSHPTPDGRVELALRMVRQVRGEYSRVALKVMYELAKEAGVPFGDINGSDSARLPEDLEPIAETILDQVTSGSDKPSLGTDQRALIRQRFTHYSANYNPFRTMTKGLVATIRLGRHFSPNAPAESGKRTIHPNN
ncbi:T6SS phospholipase effector Tle1-like catalytic domain-containing protein [Marinobacter sp. VGCF2001]|uniref:T6SS phospholipase effector Tle1-like catalytic domain-containing protein n=1 Tax=Marinobacter sp. VGCF2001 TaxID=3417189 RepID=UPI003CE72920